MIKDKQDLLNHLRTIHVNFVLGSVMPKIVLPSQWINIANDSEGFVFPENDFDLSRRFVYDSKLLCTDLANGKQEIFDFFQGSIKRNLLSSSYELIKFYCSSNNQMQKLRSAYWYDFARILRNIVSHNNGGVLMEWDKELSKPKHNIYEVQWENKIINKSMVGQVISFTDYEALNFFHTMENFVKTDLI